MVNLSSTAIEALVIQVLFVLLILRRQYAIYLGTPISAGRIVLGAVLILLVFGLLELTGYYALGSTFPGLGWAVLANVAIVVVAALIFARYAERHANVWKSPQGIWMYQMGLAPALVYVALFFARLGLEFAFFPALLEVGSVTPATAANLFQLAILEAVAALLAVSSGILLGRGMGVYRRYQRLRADGATGEAPLASGAPPAR